MNEFIYVDNSSTTKLDSRVLSKMLPYLKDYYANASTDYEIGKMSRNAIESSRINIAKCLNVKPKEIIFTGSGTEADNLALLGYARANKARGKHIVTSKIEHLAVLNTCKRLEKEGFDVTYLDVDESGKVTVESVTEAIRDDTIIISIMMVNNEIGTIEPINEIAKIARDKNIFFHTDAVQGVPHLLVDASKYDALSISAHKFNGPKGVGALYLKSGNEIEGIMYGGHQEGGIRPSTENVAGIVGMAKALKLTRENLDSTNNKINSLRRYLLDKIKDIDGLSFNGAKDGVNSIINFNIEGINTKDLKLFLELNGIYASSGSACNTSVKDVSHVFKAIGKNDNGIRISLSANNTFNEMEKISNIIHKSLKILA